MFTTGKVVFIIVFVIAFIAMLVYSYRKEYKTLRIHYKKPYLVLIGIIVFMSFLFFIVKFKKIF